VLADPGPQWAARLGGGFRRHCFRGHWRCGDHLRRLHRCGHVGGRRLAGQHARNAQRLLALLDLDLGDARLLEQLDHFFDFSNVHRSAPSLPLWRENVPNFRQFA
jgi:hypothetical protein